MRILTVLTALFLLAPAFAQTYRAGGSNRANFSAGQADAQQEETSTVPGARSNVQTRTFSSYGSRQRAWSQGVRTQTVQTQTAGTAAFSDGAAEAADRAGEALKSLGAANNKTSAPAAEKPSARPGAAQPQAGAANAGQQEDPLAAMQEMIKSMESAMPAGATGASSGTASGAMGMPGLPAGMNIPGMPDMSALMGAAAAGQQPAAK